MPIPMQKLNTLLVFLIVTCSTLATAQDKKVSMLDIAPYTERAAGLFKDKQYAEAVQEYQKGMLLVPNPIPSRNSWNFFDFSSRFTRIDSSSVAGLCWNLSYYQIFSQDFSSAIVTARRGIALDKNQALGIQTNLVLGYLFNGQYEQARKIFIGNIGAVFENSWSKRYWENVVVDDLNECIEASIQPETARAMIDTILAACRIKSLGYATVVKSSVAVRGANNKFLKLNRQNFTVNSPRIFSKLDDGSEYNLRYTFILPPPAIVAGSEEVGELESFEMCRVASSLLRSKLLNRAIFSIQNKQIAIDEFKLPLDWKVESKSPIFNSLAKRNLDSGYANTPVNSAFANSAKVQSFELIAVSPTSVRLRDNEGHYLRVDTTYGPSTVSLTDQLGPRTVFDLLNLDGTPFAHGLPVTQSKKEEYKIARTFLGIAPVGEIGNLLGRGYTEEMRDGGIVVDSEDIYENDYGYFSKQSYDVHDKFQLSANVGVLIANINANYDNTKRYMILQSFNITKIASFLKPPDIEKLRQSPIKVIISKVFYGWALNYVLQGSESTFSAEIAASIKLFNADLSTTIKKNELSTNLSLIGFTNNSKFKDAGILFDENKILASFTPLSKPVPIFVEYTVINEFDVARIDWR
jgi:tetratricopeptide (TPR) repeat protein